MKRVLSAEEGEHRSIVALGERYRAGTARPVDEIGVALARMDEVGDALGAVTDRFDDRARAEAVRLTDELGAGRDRGPLHGVPVVVKELIDVEGCRRSAGTHVQPAGWDVAAAADALVVADLRRAGAIVVARGRTHEFAWGITSRHPDGSGVVNPLDDRLIAGGSSGGVAALVAAGVAPLGVGTDTGGSVRIPASFCGLVGWKPAFDMLSTDGVVPLAPSLDHVGLLGRSPIDVAIAHAALIGLSATVPPPPRDSHRLRVARLVDDTLPDIAARSAESLDRCCRLLDVDRDVVAGSGVDEFPTSAEMVDVFGIVQPWEALAVHRDGLGTWPGQAERYGRDVAGRLQAAEALEAATVEAARRRRSALRARARRGLRRAGVDALLLPAAAGQIPVLDEPDTSRVDDRAVPLRDAVMPFTMPANVLGWPAVTFPVDDMGEGESAQIPTSVQLMAAPRPDDPFGPLVTAVDAVRRPRGRGRWRRARGWVTPN